MYTRSALHVVAQAGIYVLGIGAEPETYDVSASSTVPGATNAQAHVLIVHNQERRHDIMERIGGGHAPGAERKSGNV